MSPLIRYVDKNFQESTLAMVAAARTIIDEYLAEGYQLTLRQLYYQFVARDLIANQQREYDRLGRIVSDARLAGLIDWDAIEDRTRNLESLAHWSSPAEIVREDSRAFRIDKWARQPVRIEVWIEKEALAGVFERVCQQLDVPFFSCRGYTSQSEMWAASRRLIGYGSEGQDTMILHFGDHDPSGIDMTRDIADRMEVFGCPVDVDRIALNFDQVQTYQPPPNPAKVTDSRFGSYLRSYGRESWELDALNPPVLAALVREEVEKVRDYTLWAEDVAREKEGRKLLKAAADRWSDVAAYLDGGRPE